MGIDIERLGPAARAQVEKELARRADARKAALMQHKTRAGPILPDAGSQLEQDYYAAEIWPKMAAGLVAEFETHKTFPLLPAADYCGIKLPAIVYTPDFFIKYTNGTVEVVEVKHPKIRSLQNGYTYRRRLFIELVARPAGWKFTEYIPKQT